MNAQQARIEALLAQAKETASSAREVPVDLLTELAMEGYPLATLDHDLND